MKKLFVGNLPYSVTDADLKDMFSKAGTVSEAIVIIDKQNPSKPSKGFGFVSFDNDSEATAAIEMYDGKELEGRALTVNEARPKTEDRGNRF